MTVLRYVSLMALACWVTTVSAGKDTYQEPIQAYANELKRDTPDVQNPSFYSTLAVSQAKRSLSSARDDSVNAAEPATTSASSSRASGEFNFASPHIYGNVRGNINIVVERNAVRGNITSVR
jgi:hypothetical protein